MICSWRVYLEVRRGRTIKFEQRLLGYHEMYDEGRVTQSRHGNDYKVAIHGRATAIQKFAEKLDSNSGMLADV